MVGGKLSLPVDIYRNINSLEVEALAYIVELISCFAKILFLAGPTNM